MATELENAAAAEDDTVELEGTVTEVYPLAKQVSEALMGAVFPLERDHLVWVARENEAPRMVVSMLAGLPARTFTSLEEVQQGLQQGLAASESTDDRTVER